MAREPGPSGGGAEAGGVPRGGLRRRKVPERQRLPGAQVGAFAQILVYMIVDASYQTICVSTIPSSARATLPNGVQIRRSVHLSVMIIGAREERIASNCSKIGTAPETRFSFGRNNGGEGLIEKYPSSLPWGFGVFQKGIIKKLMIL